MANAGVSPAELLRILDASTEISQLNADLASMDQSLLHYTTLLKDWLPRLKNPLAFDLTDEMKGTIKP